MQRNRAAQWRPSIISRSHCPEKEKTVMGDRQKRSTAVVRNALRFPMLSFLPFPLYHTCRLSLASELVFLIFVLSSFRWGVAALVSLVRRANAQSGIKISDES
ncbi:hypothetical protein F5X98DRAFT_344104 [Xylaria grammica]|nr:hypothetical protein F5X98DRAFT_344104 [Xylaria grammica]